jgi:hypothetical protein
MAVCQIFRFCIWNTDMFGAGSGPRSITCMTVGCHWSLVICHWSLVICHWSLVICHWSLVRRASGQWVGESVVGGQWVGGPWVRRSVVGIRNSERRTRNSADLRAVREWQGNFGGSMKLLGGFLNFVLAGRRKVACGLRDGLGRLV